MYITYMYIRSKRIIRLKLRIIRISSSKRVLLRSVLLKRGIALRKSIRTRNRLIGETYTYSCIGIYIRLGPITNWTPRENMKIGIIPTHVLTI